jgi:hypothetical protein
MDQETEDGPPSSCHPVLGGSIVVVKPVVRYMILCEDWGTDPQNARRVSIYGLMSNIRSRGQPPYPLLYEELCVFLALTEGRGTGTAKIICIFEETDQKVFETPQRQVAFGADPLEVVGLPFRIRDCGFPRPGRYSIQFWYNGEKVAERPLLLR